MRVTIGSALLLAALGSAACKTMKAVELNQLVALKPDRVWVTEADQSVVVVDGPINVMGDTLVGYVGGKYEEMPMTAPHKLVVQRPATTKTALLIGAIAVGFGGFAYAITGAGGNTTVITAPAGDCDKHPELCGN